MGLDRYIAIVFLLICSLYGYTAFFTMDAGLPPIMQRNPIWPSTFPKVLSVAGIAISLWIAVGFEKSPNPADAEINYRHLTDYKAGQAALLLGLMAAYALLLRPAGFLLATAAFLILASAVLGERCWLAMIAVSVSASGAVWYLVDQVLKVYMRPLPSVFM